MILSATKITTLLLCIVLTLTLWAFFPGNILSWDIFGYYLYLPLIFIYNDLGLKDYSIIENIIHTYWNTSSFYQGVHAASGEWVIKYTAGMSVLYSPWFLIAHLAARVFGYPADGFSLPFQYSIAFGSLLYTFIGIVFLRKILLEFFTERVAAATMIIIVFGTNYFLHTSIHGQGAMTHNYLFTLYAILVWYTIQWHKTPRIKNILWIGIAAGLAILVRPTEIVCTAIPLMWGVYNRKTFADKFSLLQKYKYQVCLFVSIIVLLFLPQSFYWKTYMGMFFFNAYTSNPGEGFEFFHPYFLEVLFSFRKGWLIYTPVMFFSLFGFYRLYKLNKTVFVPVFIYFICNFYVVASWSAWWYADSFGQRALIPSYAVLAIPLGYFISGLWGRRILRAGFGVVAAFFILLNVFQSWQMTQGILHTSRNSREYYWRVFGKTEISDEDRKLLLVDHYDSKNKMPNESEYTKMRSFELDYEIKNNDTLNYNTRIFCSGASSLLLDSNAYSPKLTAPYRSLTDKSHAWVRINLWVYPFVPADQNLASVVISFSHHGWPYQYKTIDIESFPLQENKWNLISGDYLTPEVRTIGDSLSVYVWNMGKEKILLDKLSVDVYEPKFDPSIF